MKFKTLLMSFHCCIALLLFLKSYGGKKKKSPIYKEIEKTDTLKLFNIAPVMHNDASVFLLIHHLRNAVAHADFSVDYQMSFTFSDNDSQWQASITIDDLMIFLTKAGTILENYGLMQKQGKHDSRQTLL